MEFWYDCIYAKLSEPFSIDREGFEFHRCLHVHSWLMQHTSGVIRSGHVSVLRGSVWNVDWPDSAIFAEMAQLCVSLVSIGVMEYLPPQIKDRPPRFRCRDELETPMASENYLDWIKIRGVEG